MKVDKVALGMLVAGLLLVALAFVAPQPKSGAPSAPAEARAAQPEVEGHLLIYVNGELKYSGKAHSFLKPAPTMLYLAMAPVSSAASASVTFYSDRCDSWSVPYRYYYGSNYTYAMLSGSHGDGYVWARYYSGFGGGPRVLVYDSRGNKWAEIAPSTTPSVSSNATGVLLSVSASVTPSLTNPTNVSMLRWVIPHVRNVGGSTTYFSVRLAEDALPSPVTVNPGDSLTVVYQFYFKADQVYTENFAQLFFAFLLNHGSAVGTLTATDGSTVRVAASGGGDNAYPQNAYIVLGNGSARFSRTAYKVQSEVARAEASAQVSGGGVSWSYAFTLNQDTAITELALYVKMSNGKYVMLLYYVLPQPTIAKAGAPFTVTFRISLPYADRV
jgi:hypothetical protein